MTDHAIEVLEIGRKVLTTLICTVRPLRVKIDGIEFTGSIYLIFNGGVLKSHYRISLSDKQVYKHPDWPDMRKRILHLCCNMEGAMSRDIARLTGTMEGSWQETKTKFAYVPGVIFVFGSNLAGRHGLGAAKFARFHYGAKYGIGWGRVGDSYAIPTKDSRICTLSLAIISRYVRDFLEYTIAHPELKFLLTRVGCGLAGYNDSQMAPLFKGLPNNVEAPKEWEPYLSGYL